MSKPKTAPSEYAAIVRKFARVFAISETKARAEIATRTCAQCATCARNLNRYEIRMTFRISVFAEPPCAFSASDCEYYLQDARKPDAAE